MAGEEQFKTNGTIWIYKRKEVIESWKVTKNIILTGKEDDNKAVTDEARRLGFGEEIFEMQVLSGYDLNG